MLHIVIAFVIGAVIGFACGRVKNAAKLAAVKADIEKAEAGVKVDAAKVLAEIKAKL